MTCSALGASRMTPYSARPTGESLSDSRSEARSALAVARRNSSAAGSPHRSRMASTPCTRTTATHGASLPRRRRAAPSRWRAKRGGIAPPGACGRGLVTPTIRSRSESLVLDRFELAAIGTSYRQDAARSEDGPARPLIYPAAERRAMSRDITVVLQDRPGELARLGEATGRAGVNIHGMCAFTGEGRGVIHLLFDDGASAAARRALEEADMGIADEREVLVIDVSDQPGTLGGLARALGEANVNIELAYTTFGGIKLVIATDDLESARAALE